MSLRGRWDLRRRQLPPLTVCEERLWPTGLGSSEALSCRLRPAGDMVWGGHKMHVTWTQSSFPGAQYLLIVPSPVLLTLQGEN